MMHESRRSVDNRRSTAFVPMPPESVFCTETSDAVDARIPPTVLSAGTGVEAVCARMWKK